MRKRAANDEGFSSACMHSNLGGRGAKGLAGTLFFDAASMASHRSLEAVLTGSIFNATTYTVCLWVGTYVRFNNNSNNKKTGT